MINRKITTLGIVVVTLVSCQSIKYVKVPEPVDNAVQISPKKNITPSILQTWSYADLATDSIPGISLQKAYQFLEGKKNNTVIVAVLDSGTDITHPDLKQVVWTNTKEIENNGVDDDKNGFVDDVHGWNFLGKTYNENLEIARMYRMLKPLYEGKNEVNFKGEDLDAFLKFKLLQNDFNENLARVKNSQQQYGQYLNMLESTHQAMVNLTGKTNYKLLDLEVAVADNEFLRSQKELAIKVLSNGTTFPEQIKQIEPAVDHYDAQVNYFYNVNFDGRAPLANDGYDMKTKIYGDNNVKDQGDDEIHGTHVSGIILADAKNETGVYGIANNALLMPVRVVPNGDEYDKDVALGIRYAVDNGAKVINTSFGKGYSPKANWVYDAIKYAAKHDVLIVNAAGNDAKNIDKEACFPTDAPDFEKEIADNFLTVGAITRSYNEDLLADFTNYGKNNVDIFSPGHDIYNTIPNNKYKFLSGTSMASPTTAGVATLIKSYYPQLSASQVKHIIMNSGINLSFKVKVPGTENEMVTLDQLCKSGRVLNAYNALQMADQMVNKK